MIDFYAGGLSIDRDDYEAQSEYQNHNQNFQANREPDDSSLIKTLTDMGLFVIKARIGVRNSYDAISYFESKMWGAYKNRYEAESAMQKYADYDDDVYISVVPNNM